MGGGGGVGGDGGEGGSGGSAGGSGDGGGGGGGLHAGGIMLMVPFASMIMRSKSVPDSSIPSDTNPIRLTEYPYNSGPLSTHDVVDSSSIRAASFPIGCVPSRCARANGDMKRGRAFVGLGSQLPEAMPLTSASWLSPGIASHPLCQLMGKSMQSDY